MVTAQAHRATWWRTAAVIAAAAVLGLSGCASDNADKETASGPSTTAVSPAKVPEIAATLPEDIRKSGKLIVGVNIPYAPNEFKDGNGKIVGFDVDLMNAVAATLGLTVDYREADFAKIIPSIQEGTYNVGMSSFTDTKERQQSVDFVNYFSAGIQWAKRPGTAVDPDNACGKKVAVQATTIEETEELPAKSKKCTDEGKPAIEIIKFDGQDAATNAVVLGQAERVQGHHDGLRARGDIAFRPGGGHQQRRLRVLVDPTGRQHRAHRRSRPEPHGPLPMQGKVDADAIAGLDVELVTQEARRLGDGVVQACGGELGARRGREIDVRHERSGTVASRALAEF